MQFVKIPLKHAESLRKKLIEAELVNTDVRWTKEDDGFLVAVLDEDKVKELAKKNKIKVSFEERKANEVRGKSPKNLGEALQGKIPDDVLPNIKTAFDTVGSIAIVEIDPEQRKYEKVIAETLLNMTKHVDTVLRKDDAHEGQFRTQKMKWLAGEKTKETQVIENGIRMLVDVEQVYYSIRLSTERKRISQLVKKGEEVLVMFSGAAPFVCVIAKNTEAAHVSGIEVNPIGHEYGLKNIALNKIKNAFLVCGDVHKVIPTLHKKYDRIVMPAPKNAPDFLDDAISVADKGTWIHLYMFLHEKDFGLAEEHVKKACERAEVHYKHYKLHKCGQHAPRTWRVCADFRVN